MTSLFLPGGAKTLQPSTFSYFLLFLGLFYQCLFHGPLIKYWCFCLFVFLPYISTLCNRNHSVALASISMLIPNALFQPRSPPELHACVANFHKGTSTPNVKTTSSKSVPFIGCFEIKSPKIKSVRHSRFLLPHSSHLNSFPISRMWVLLAHSQSFFPFPLLGLSSAQDCFKSYILNIS